MCNDRRSKKRQYMHLWPIYSAQRKLTISLEITDEPLLDSLGFNAKAQLDEGEKCYIK
jgi:hypothetical protein